MSQAVSRVGSVQWRRSRCLMCATEPEVPGSALCTDCDVTVARARRLRSVEGLDHFSAPFEHAGMVKELMAAAKFRARLRVLDWFANEMIRGIQDLDVDCITWIPGSWQGRLDRGFDPSQVLARRIGALVGVKVCRLLARAPGSPQRSRSLAGRHAGPALVLACRDVPERLLLVDDVCTTGASLHAAAVVLRAAGARSIEAVVATSATSPSSPDWSAPPPLRR